MSKGPRPDDVAMNPKLIRAVLLATLSLLFAASALAAPEIVRSGNLFLSDNGGLSPLKLPRHGLAPATATLEAEIGTSDGSHPPALQTVDLEVAKSVVVDAVGLPVCEFGQIAATSTGTAKRSCGQALLGSGSATVEVAFPEQAPFSASGPLLLFNGGVKGATTTVFLHAYVDIPAPTAIVVAAQIIRIHRGPYGLELRARIPQIAGGSGSVTKFSLKVGRKFTYRGRHESFITAGCPAGHWSTRGEAGFSDGTKLQVLHVFPCTPTA